MKKRALISVSDKSGVVELSKKLKDFGYEIVSTGGTFELLNSQGIEVVEVSKVTSFEEILNGKVKTLHPKVFGGILADMENPKERAELEKHLIEPFSLVIVNLYPFEKVAQEKEDVDILVKNIDIGGVTLIRAGAKNYKSVAVVTSPSQYKELIVNLSENKGDTSVAFRERLSVQAFELTSCYDSIIAAAFSKELAVPKDFFSLNLKKSCDLRYGENPHQKACLYEVENGLDYEILNGKELSYNNIVDVSSALAIVSEFYDVNATAIVKHTIPCGVALGADIYEAYQKAFDCDPVSAFGGIIAFSKPVNRQIAMHAGSMFLEVVVAPDFDDDALEILRKKKNLRLIKVNTPLQIYKTIVNKEFKATAFGVLVQESDRKELDKNTFKIVTKSKPTPEQIEDAVFAWKVSKHVKSNGIVLAKDLKTLAISGGQTSRVDAVEIALNKSCDSTKDAVLASDGFFPAVDNVNAAAQGRIACIIQPAGSIKDEEVVKACDKFNISMITTGIRHFKH